MGASQCGLSVLRSRGKHCPLQGAGQVLNFSSVSVHTAAVRLAARRPCLEPRRAVGGTFPRGLSTVEFVPCAVSVVCRGWTLESGVGSDVRDPSHLHVTAPPPQLTHSWSRCSVCGVCREFTVRFCCRHQAWRVGDVSQAAHSHAPPLSLWMKGNGLRSPQEPRACAVICVTSRTRPQRSPRAADTHVEGGAAPSQRLGPGTHGFE